MADIENLLVRLHGRRKMGNGNWLAKCPAHEDRSPSLSLKQTDDGTILLHCFGGCGVNEVLAALGLDARELFPKDLNADNHHSRSSHGFDAYTALKALDDDSLVLLAACRMTINGEKLTESDMDRLVKAYDHVASARSFVMGRRTQQR